MIKWCHICTLCFILSSVISNAQDKTFNVYIDEQGDTSYWFNYKNDLIKNLKIKNIESSETKFSFRFFTGNRVITIYQDSSEALHGSIVSWAKESLSEIERKKRNPKYFTHTKKLDSLELNNFYALISHSNILTIPSEEYIRDWSSGLDGYNFIIETNNNKRYSLKSYWTPNSFDSLSEAIIINAFYDSMHSILQFDSIRYNIPFKCYTNGGSVSVCVTTTKYINIKRRKRILTYGGLGFIGVTHFGLSQLWYKDYPKSSFHFINDNREWLQMDKLGHAYSSYYLGVMGIEAMKWAGYSRKKAIWLGGLYGTFFQTPIEIQDGFSKQWGASVGDVVANSFGTALAISQQLKWNEQRIALKYSFSPSKYASARPNALGNGITEEFLKDYNGQTYWLSANISSFLKTESKFPKWLNLSAGYGADGMIGGEDNIWEDKDGFIYDHSTTKRSRQYYLAPDINFANIKTEKKGLKALFIILNAIKTPAPTLELNNGGLKFHWIKF